MRAPARRGRGAAGVADEGDKKDDGHDEALAAWERGELPAGTPAAGGDQGPDDDLGDLDGLTHLPGDPDGYVAPPRRSAFPPSIFVVLALGLATLALEPTSDLSYDLFGPGVAFDVGEPGHYRLDEVEDGARVKMAGLLGERFATYTRFGTAYEVRQLLGTAVLVRRAPRRVPLGRDEVERYEGEGRLLKLDVAPSSFLERLVRPSARYTTLRLQFATYGELPVGRDAYLLLEGELPRAHLVAVLTPFALWALALAAAWAAFRAVRQNRDYRSAVDRLRRMT